MSQDADRVHFTAEDVARIPGILQRLYAAVDELGATFGRHFTLDGHLLGSIGECLAAYHYDLQLSTASNAGFDAVSRVGVQVEIKATQGNRIGLRSVPEHLLVLQLHRCGGVTQIYNAPGAPLATLLGRRQRPANGQYGIGCSQLAQLQTDIPMHAQLPIYHALPKPSPISASA